MCVYARVYTRVHDTRPGQSGWGGSCVLALCILLWADGICLVPLLCQVTHPSVDLGKGFTEVVCFPGVCLMVNLTEMAPTGPSASLATRPPSVLEPCLLSLLGQTAGSQEGTTFLKVTHILLVCCHCFPSSWRVAHSLAGWLCEPV